MFSLREDDDFANVISSADEEREKKNAVVQTSQSRNSCSLKYVLCDYTRKKRARTCAWQSLVAIVLELEAERRSGAQSP